MIRWKYVLPRVVLVAIVWLSFVVFFDPLLRGALVSSGRAVTGLPVNLGSVRTSFLHTRLTAYDFQLGSPVRQDENLFELKSASLELESGAVSQRKFVVRKGAIHGLKIGTPRSLASDAGLTIPSLTNFAGVRMQGWLEDTGRLVSVDQLQELEGVQLAQSLRRKWPDRYQQLQQRVEELNQRIQRLKELCSEEPDNVVDVMQAYRERLGELEAIREDVIRIQRELQGLPEEVQLDQHWLAEAFRRDLQAVREHVELATLDSETVSQYLLGEKLGKHVVTAVQWLQWIRKYTDVELAEAERFRGEEIVFVQQDELPSFLCRKLVIDGDLTSGNTPLPFRGTIADLTAEPKKHGKPTVIRLQLKGELPLWVEATIDRTGEVPVDTLTITTAGRPLKEIIVGDERSLAMKVALGEVRMQVVVRLTGDKLEGGVIIEGDELQLVPLLGDKLDDQPFGKHLTASLESVKRFQARAQLSGTGDQPKWKLESTLGRQFSGALREGMAKEIEQGKDQAEAWLRAEFDSQNKSLETAILEKEQAILGQLQGNEAMVLALKQQLARRIGLPQGILSKLPR